MATKHRRSHAIGKKVFLQATVAILTTVYIVVMVSQDTPFIVASKDTFSEMLLENDGIQRVGDKGYLYEIDDCVNSVNRSIVTYYNLASVGIDAYDVPSTPVIMRVEKFEENPRLKSSKVHDPTNMQTDEVFYNITSQANWLHTLGIHDPRHLRAFFNSLVELELIFEVRTLHRELDHFQAFDWQLRTLYDLTTRGGRIELTLKVVGNHMSTQGGGSKAGGSGYRIGMHWELVMGTLLAALSLLSQLWVLQGVQGVYPIAFTHSTSPSPLKARDRSNSYDKYTDEDCPASPLGGNGKEAAASGVGARVDQVIADVGEAISDAMGGGASRAADLGRGYGYAVGGPGMAGADGGGMLLFGYRVSPWVLVNTAGNMCTIAAVVLSFGEVAGNPFARRSSSQGLMGFACFLTWSCLVQHIEYMPPYDISWVAMRRGLPVVLRFMVGSSPLFMGFACLGMSLFSEHAEKFNSLGNSLITLFSVMNGDVLLETSRDIEHDSSPLGDIYLVVFVCIFSFVIMSVFVSIIQDSYQSAKHGTAGSYRGIAPVPLAPTPYFAGGHASFPPGLAGLAEAEAGRVGGAVGGGGVGAGLEGERAAEVAAIAAALGAQLGSLQQQVEECRRLQDRLQALVQPPGALHPRYTPETPHGLDLTDIGLHQRIGGVAMR